MLGFPQQTAKLLDTVLAWSKAHEINTIYLGTTLKFKAVHRFYEKNGFREIKRNEMPPYCQPMDCDEKFYCLDLKNLLWIFVYHRVLLYHLKATCTYVQRFECPLVALADLPGRVPQLEMLNGQYDDSK
ncbi:MAG: hypothetical protein S4CHLAM123_06590 [Chlamydiales bacterium]|nr:hypothetical protein [Chlamydiales bacterium]